jgi:hypothetical protein
MEDIAECIKGIFDDWLIDNIRRILIGCFAFGGGWVAGHLALAHYVPIYDVVAIVSKVWDVLGIADGCLFFVALVNYGIHWVYEWWKSL